MLQGRSSLPSVFSSGVLADLLLNVLDVALICEALAME